MRTRNTRGLTLVLVALTVLGAAAAGAQTKLLRFPDIWGDKVAFCYAGDVWVAPAGGGTAVRLTTHPGLELFPKFSPDGKWIAFTGQYDGDEQVYVIPSMGGVPRQLTFYPARGPLPPRGGWDNQVYGWTRDGKSVVFRSLRDAGGESRTRLYTVALEGGPEKPLPMYSSGAGDFSPDMSKMVYSPLMRDFRTWKRYQGGWAEDLWIIDLKTLASENITNNPRTDRDPMWVGNAICFASDRDGTLNLYRYDLASKKTEELTHSTKWDVRWPSTDHGTRIVYELDGELQVFDITTRQDRKIPITVPTDGLAMRPSHYAVEKYIEGFALAPKGERALFVARGDVFTVPIEKGPTRNLTDSSNAHDKWARWSPDGARIAFISDRTGEEQVWLVNQDGLAGLVQLTTDLKAMLYAPEWSPDGSRIAFSDKDGKLYVVGVGDKKLVQVARETRGLLEDYAWSPRGSFLAFSLSNPNGFRSLYIWSVADGQLHRVTDEYFNSRGPAWDPEGNYLYFLSDREYAPMISRKEFNYAAARTTGIFALALRKDSKNPFGPESDEVAIGEKKKDEEKADKEKVAAAEKEKPKEGRPEKKDEPLRIDFDGLAARVSRVPVEADNYENVSAVKGYLLYVRRGSPFNGRESYAKSVLVIFAMKDREASVLVEDAPDYALSADGSKVLVQQGKSYNLYDAKPKAKDKKTVSTKDMYVDRVPAQEWTEIFNEVWRRYRDFFYVRNMHGYDWKALHDQYATLLPYVAHRADLTYVLGEMVSELNVGHTYIEGGDYETPERPRVGLPGARFELDEKVGRFRIVRIFQGQNEEEQYRAPLTEVGVDARVGDYVLAIDSEDLKGGDNVYRLLKNKKDPVTLTLNSTPTMDGARRVTYKPIFSEASLIYLDWVNTNREKVAKMTDGRVGYLHIPDMGAPGISEFIKWYYPQIRKEGLIVDVRANGGGSVSQQIIERLNRKLLGTTFSSLREDTGTYPGTVFYGHMVCLLNETSASDGDIFPYMFRQAGLGPLIGKRSWGGVVGISGRGPLLDGGQAFVPQGGMGSVDGKWIIEGHGVDPDIVVENDPASVAQGKDPQLERGVAEVMKAIKDKPMKLPPRPPDPVKTK
jgi:tricorn protease